MRTGYRLAMRLSGLMVLALGAGWACPHFFKVCNFQLASTADADTVSGTSTMQQVYKIYAGGNGTAFESPDITADTGDIGGVATLFLNGDPVCAVTNRIVICPINQYVRNGNNTLTASGSFTGKVYAKVGRFTTPQNFLIGKQVFSAHGVVSPLESDKAVGFEAIAGHGLPERELLSKDPKKAEIYKKEIRTYIGCIASDLRSHKGKDLEDKLYYGHRLWDAECYNLPFTPEKSQQAVDFWGNKENVLDENTPSPSITFGDRLVMVAAQAYTSDSQERYLFIMHCGQARFVVRPLFLARVAGVWQCWSL